MSYSKYTLERSSYVDVFRFVDCNIPRGQFSTVGFTHLYQKIVQSVVLKFTEFLWMNHDMNQYAKYTVSLFDCREQASKKWFYAK